ncbi:uncharacterized protein PAC_17694 [Phialocephala subalpina]|uniref:Uncharacterized protein n=1 Tax=Phialocephala subalpina TaxID=576137 RepID=A0A1L7XS17_9HELO|nr:uncharacterized protein PAC_17694 [Phialocephala subalpina]
MSPPTSPNMERRYIPIPPAQAPGFGSTGPWALVGPKAMPILPNTTIRRSYVPPFVPPRLPISPPHRASQNEASHRPDTIYEDQFQLALARANTPPRPQVASSFGQGPVQGNKRKRAIPDKRGEHVSSLDLDTSSLAHRLVILEVPNFFQAPPTIEDGTPRSSPAHAGSPPPPHSSPSRYNVRLRYGPSSTLKGRRLSAARSYPSPQKPSPPIPLAPQSSSRSSPEPPKRMRLWANDRARPGGP